MTQQSKQNEKTTKRLFIGIPIEGVEAAGLSRAFEMYRAEIHSRFPGTQIRPIPAQNYHITLQFFGECSESQANQIKAEIKSWTPKCQVPIQLQIETFGILPLGREGQTSAPAPKHLVAFIKANHALNRLHERVVQLLQSLGLYIQLDRDFLPHITLAHLKGDQALRNGHFTVGAACLNIHAHQVCLFESHLRSYGAFYQALECVRLNEFESLCGWV